MAHAAARCAAPCRAGAGSAQAKRCPPRVASRVAARCARLHCRGRLCRGLQLSSHPVLPRDRLLSAQPAPVVAAPSHHSAPARASRGGRRARRTGAWSSRVCQRPLPHAVLRGSGPRGGAAGARGAPVQVVQPHTGRPAPPARAQCKLPCAQACQGAQAGPLVRAPAGQAECVPAPRAHAVLSLSRHAQCPSRPGCCGQARKGSSGGPPRLCAPPHTLLH